MVWDSLLDCGSLEWQRTLKGLYKAHDVAYQDVTMTLTLCGVIEVSLPLE